jgi:peptide-methionine (R)-S-oxide reductase
MSTHFDPRTPNRRGWLAWASALLGTSSTVYAQSPAPAPAPKTPAPKIEPLVLTDAQWRARLSPEQYAVLREEGTERPGTSPLNNEKRKGVFQCAGCDLPLFTTAMKYDSGTGWPSLFTTLPGVFRTKRDFKLILPRTEYHCARCGGHHGHVFDDGPQPTGLRYCNNGVALKFVPEAA